VVLSSLFGVYILNISNFWFCGCWWWESKDRKISLDKIFYFFDK